MNNYRINIIAEVMLPLSKNELESKLVVSLFDVETHEKISDGESKKFEVIDYEITEAISILNTKNGG